MCGYEAVHGTACATAIKATQSKSSEIGAEREKIAKKRVSVQDMPIVLSG